LFFRNQTLALAGVVGSLILGCGPESRPDAAGSARDSQRPGGEGRVRTIEDGSGFVTQIDATDPERWVYFSFLDGEVDGPAPADDTGWDLAFRRSNIKVNGGHSGAGRVAVAVLSGLPFSDVEQAPVDGYESDRSLATPDDSDRPDFIDDDGTDFVFGRANDASSNGWFDYDPVQHVLSPADVVFVVRSTDGRFYRLRMLDYYDAAGTSGFPTFRWSEIAPPIDELGLEGFTFDASSRDGFVHLDLSRQSLVDVTDPARSTDWDLAIRRTSMATNGGSSGPGFGGALVAVDADYDAITSSDTLGFILDAEIEAAGPPGSPTISANPVLADWFDYDPTTHSVRPAHRVFLVRTAIGDVAKLQILDWDDGRYRVRSDLIPVQPQTHQRTIDASDSQTWVGFSLSQGDVAEDEWDLAFRRTSIRTASGTSDDGRGGALRLDRSFEDVMEAPGEGYEQDEMLAGSRPGSPDVSANPILADWFDYDFVTHTVSPKEETYVVRLRDGSYAKFEISGYEDGRFSVRFVYAGPNRRAFR
jgi:hypothetical protein